MILGMALAGVMSPYSALSESFAGQPDGYVPSADSSHNWWMVSNGGANANLRVVSGALTNVSVSGLAAGYITSDLGQNVAQIGSTFVFSPGNGTTAGNVAMVVWQSLLRTAAVIPPTGCHLVIGTTGWAFGYPEVLASGNFASALIADGVTAYSASVLISGSTATITLPDNSIQVVTNSIVSSRSGRYPCFEVYQTEASTDTKPAFRAVEAQ